MQFWTFTCAAAAAAAVTDIWSGCEVLRCLQGDNFPYITPG